jgi:hypothetical protein
MIDKLESLENIKQFVAMTERIKKKYKVGVTYDLPKLPGVSFRIKDFDREKMKIDVTLRKGLQVVQKKLSEEDFYKLLYQPELFYSEFGHMGKSS